MPIIAQIASGEVLETAFEWLCHRRLKYSANSDIWSFRRNWSDEKTRIRREVRAGQYRFDLLSRITLSNGDAVDLWSSRDALVLKALALVLAEYLPVSRRCAHVKGHGGAKYAVRDVRDHLADNHFVFRTDVKSYYASIDHLKLLDQVAVYIKDRRVMNLIGQYLRRTSERGGCFWDFEKGISLGCPLSPLIGAFFLSAVDDALDKTGLFYIRFMDDILVLAPSRWKLRHAVRTVNQALASLAVEKHPDKTFIGRIERGFDFLGYHFSRVGLTIARKTIANFITKASRLYEQKRSTVLADAALEMYVKRWARWAKSGLEAKMSAGKWCLPTETRCPAILKRST